ncbi:patatin-like phospholipase family protein [Fervidibacillus halotolerans]|uniref:Patatin-like phospholipase family protein n=1 Tax=Fervidibacillus halotolerans TaxID=2980027 RepID=A0A9E8LY45_9BACI|nr:patatin-like phospholipase family protein [Fervidibacillus halotolerans]WAA11435.1 patatin-like phospholipase family protein [Fervidibacillus halotolerans]
MYVDGVFSGGGVKGFAFIGACEVLERRGIRFKRVAGTSAGAILAAFLAAGYTSQEIFQELNTLDLKDMLDEPRFQSPISILKWIPIYWRLGLYKGDALEGWVKDRLKKKGIFTFSDLSPGKLRLIASDLTNGRLVVLPDDLRNYHIHPQTFSVAKAVRMSCSLPFFFEPVRIKTKKGKAIIVDGGVLSNFPMWLFDQSQVKLKRPVIGIKLSANEKDQEPRKIENALKLFEALFVTMKDAHDARYISGMNKKNIIFIPTEGIMASEFSLTEEKKEALLQLGREQAEKFLKGWS